MSKSMRGRISANKLRGTEARFLPDARLEQNSMRPRVGSPLRPNYGSRPEMHYTIDGAFVCFGRQAVLRDMFSNDRFWLQAEVPADSI